MDDSQPTRYRSERYLATLKRQKANPLAYKPARDLLSALGRYGYLTKDQFIRLLYSPGSRTFVDSWLEILSEQGYVHDRNWLRIQSMGAAPRVWTFTDRGRKWLLQAGFADVPHIVNHRQPQQNTLDHLYTVNQTLIACELLAKRSGGAIEVLDLKSDELMHKYPMTLQIDGKRTDVVPDGLVVFGYGDHKSSYCIEVDRATEVITPWRAKIRNYITAIQGDPSIYTQTFGLRVPTILTVVSPKEGVRYKSAEGRLVDLLKWTELELEQLGMQAWARLFRFTAVPPEETDPRIFFGGSHWSTPFTPAKTPLWEGVL